MRRTLREHGQIVLRVFLESSLATGPRKSVNDHDRRRDPNGRAVTAVVPASNLAARGSA
jgi:hypothetical protein